MKCQIRGCNRSVNHLVKIQGIYNGVYVDESVCHCGRHQDATVTKAVELAKQVAVAACATVNPFAEACKAIRSA